MERRGSERTGEEKGGLGEKRSGGEDGPDAKSKLDKLGLGIQACQALASKLVKLANGAVLRCSNAASFV